MAPLPLMLERIREKYPSQQSTSIWLEAGQRYSIEVLHKEGWGHDHVSVAWSGPVGARRMISGQFLSTFVLSSDDTDGDGLLNYEEMYTYQTDPFRVDSDEDGLSDLDEVEVYETDPWESDTDEDGYSDNEEVNTRHTDPLLAEDVEWREIDAALGRQAVFLRGAWQTKGNRIYSLGLNGELGFALSVQRADLYQVAVSIRRRSDVASRAEIPFAFRVYVDELYIGRVRGTLEGREPKTLAILTPYLNEDDYQVRLVWENVYDARAVQIDRVSLQEAVAAAGASIEAWRADHLHRVARITKMPAQSRVSPAQIEGVARFIELMSLSDGTLPQQGAGNGWAADVPLDADEPKEVTLSFQSGAKTETVSIEWISTDLLQATNQYARVGDAFKFVAGEPGGGAVTVDIGADHYEPAAGEVFMYTFAEAGAIPVEVMYAEAGGSQTNHFVVEVIEAVASTNVPVLWQDRPRSWTWQGVPEVAELSAVDLVATELSRAGQSRDLILIQGEVEPTHHIAARLGPEGPIIGGVATKAFWLKSVVDGFYHIEERLDDGTLKVRNDLFINDSFPDDVEIKLDVFVDGVVLDDGAMTRTLSRADFDEYGRYTYHLFKPEELGGSVCHHARVYQNGALIARR